MVETGNLTHLFHGLVRDALASQQVEASEATECYLVHLLEAFARPGRGDLLDPPLAIDYLEAGHLPASQRFEKLKRVADTALFVTGVFVDSLDRKLVGADYYSTLGRTAYARLSSDPVQTGLAQMFAELASRFPDLVGVLMEISEREMFRREQDTLRLYKRWLATRSGREADLLLRRGILPVAPANQRRH